MVINEGIRFMPPSDLAPVVFDRDVTLANKLTIKKGDQVRVLHFAIMKNPKEWQRPTEFLPDRFNPESPLFLTRDGKKRHPMSFLPWGSGKRVCFGKTFAEAKLKVILTYLTQRFDFELVDKEKYAGKYPYSALFQNKIPPIMIRLTHRKQ